MMAKHISYLICEDSRAQAAFYIEALGGEIVSITTGAEAPGMPEELKDKVLHLCLNVAGVNLFMADSMMEPLQRGNNVNLLLEFKTEPEARQAFDNLSKGGKVSQPLEPAFWGPYYGQFEDQFGIQWMIVTEMNAG
ncbi:VOC family protein [Gorillibacterium sp. sgz5001074]|uniref:VOC family protein n=1 Tax=Gorillibacterium sp. sgz5001074 TaxID=3446695 RepID=UPI003F679142